MKFKLLLQAAALITGLGGFVHNTYAASSDASSWLAEHPIAKSVLVKKSDSSLRWINGTLLSLEGRGFTDTFTSYSRVSNRFQGSVTSGVWTNGKDSSGVTLRFITDSPAISASWKATDAAMSHMAWTGSGGLDLYAREGDKWVYRGTGKPTGVQSEAVLQTATGRQAVATEYLLFLPLYSPVESIQIGVNATANVAKGPTIDSGKRPIVFYGTSITQGGCASRTGMAHTCILRRWMDYPMINLGFSGSGKCEPVMAELLAEIPAAIYVIETVPNMTAEMVNERAIPFISSLRTLQPNTPILMVESPNAKNADRNAAWRNAFNQLTSTGISNLKYLAVKDTGDMYGTREEATVDGTHPTDLGFYQMALYYEPVLREMLEQTQAGNTGPLQPAN